MALFDFVFQSAKRGSLRDKIDYFCETYTDDKKMTEKKFLALVKTITNPRDRFVFALSVAPYYYHMSHSYSNKVAEMLKEGSHVLPIEEVKKCIEQVGMSNHLLKNQMGTVLFYFDDKRDEFFKELSKDSNCVINKWIDNANIVNNTLSNIKDIDERVTVLKNYYESFPELVCDQGYESKDPYMWALTNCNDVGKITQYYNKFKDKFENKSFACCKIILTSSIQIEGKKKLFYMFKEELNEEEFNSFLSYLVTDRTAFRIISECKDDIPLNYIIKFYSSNKNIHHFGSSVQKEMSDYAKRITPENASEYAELFEKILYGSGLESNEAKKIIDGQLIPLRDKFNEKDFDNLLSIYIAHYISQTYEIKELFYNDKQDQLRLEVIKVIKEYQPYLTMKGISNVFNNIKFGNSLGFNFKASKNLEFAMANSDIVNYDILEIKKSDFDNPKFQEYLFSRVNIPVEERPKFIAVAKYLTGINANIFKTLNIELLSNRYLDMFEKNVDGVVSYPSLRVIGRYPDIQKQIIDLDDEHLRLFKDVFREIVSDDYDYTVLLKRVLDNFNSKEIVTIVAKEIDNYSEEERKKIIDSLVFVLCNKKLRVKGIDTLLNMEDAFTRRFKEKSFDSLEEAKKNLLFFKYGLGLNEAISYCRRYASILDLNNPNLTEEDKKLVTILMQIKHIVMCNDLNELQTMALLSREDKCHLDFRFAACFEAHVRKMYARLYNKDLLQVENLKKCNDNLGTDQDVYFAFDDSHPEFKMLLTSVGAYHGVARPKNYADDWNRPSDSVHAFCTSLISNQMMGTAPIELACLGFTHIPENNLLLAAPFDIASSSANIEMDTALKMSDDRVKFLPPDDFIDYTRHTHNELVLDRFIESEKVTPDYVILMVEKYSPDIIKRWRMGLAYPNERQDYNRFINAIQASKDFGIPIVIVDRSRIKEHERKEIEKMYQEFDKTHDITLLKKILNRFENNRAGSRNYWQCTGFEEDDIRNLLNRLLDSIERYGVVNKEFANKAFDEIISWRNTEMAEKVGRKGATLSNKELGFSPTKLIDEIEVRKERLDKKIGNYSGESITYLLCSDEEMSLTDAISKMDDRYFGRRAEGKEHIKKQKDIKEVVKEVREHQEELETIYKDPKLLQAYMGFDSKIHGMEHIEDVILFTKLVSSKDCKNEREARLCMEAAKYHDCGRSDDKHSDHGVSSAEKALEILKQDSTLSSKDLAVIYTAIATHDIHLDEHFKDNIRQTYIDISKKLNNNDLDNMNEVMLVCRILRDADALDRTRFRDDSKSYLKEHRISPTAQQYVDFSLRISEYHAILKLRKMIEDGIIKPSDVTEQLDVKDPVKILTDIQYQLKASQEKENRHYGK